MKSAKEIIDLMWQRSEFYRQSDIEALRTVSQDFADLANQLENSIEYDTFHRHDNENEIRQSEEFQMAVKNLMEHRQEADALGENEMSYNYRALSNDKYEDAWLGTKVYDELVKWANEQGMSLKFYDRANIRGEYHLCFTLRW